MPHRLNLFPDLCLFLISMGLQTVMTRWVLENPRWRTRSRVFLLALVNLLYFCASALAYLMSFNRTWRYLPATLATWIQASGMILTVTLTGFCMGMWVWRHLPPYQSRRRRFLQTAGTAIGVAPFVGTSFGILVRNQFYLNEVDIKIPNLAKDLDGLRMVQITDIHLSPFLSERQFARAIDMANETKAHLGLVTGDLITRAGDPLEACLRQLTRLRAEAGVLGCLGNHERFAQVEDYVTQQGRRIGIEFLRSHARQLRFGNAEINLAGVDYQVFHSAYLVGAETLVVPGQLNVLLSHNPDVFPIAAQKGFDLTIAGHTHGGQVNVEILHQNVNVARTFTPYVRGLYRQGSSAIHVSSGIGTIGVPVRVGAPPEVTLIRLCAS
ncbi:MAG: metallophosphoesterase [Acidobacteriaceae bacterium]|nr:metallophosphoesterase [Acidobacteriaceae bacterium]